MNKIKSFAITAAFALALAFTFSCSSDDGDDNKGSGGEGKGTNGSILITETFSRNANCDEGKICLTDEGHYESWCKDDGTFKINSRIWYIEYSIDNKVLSLDFDFEYNPIKFNGTSDKLEGTWTRSKNKEESCREYCDYGWDYTKAVFTSTTASFTREVCFEDYDVEEYRGWTEKAIDCSNVEYSKGNEKIKMKHTFTNGKDEFSYTYNNKTCVDIVYKNITESKAQQACKSAYDKAIAEGSIYYVYSYYYGILNERDKYNKCLKDNNFPKDYFGDYDDNDFVFKSSPKKPLTQKALTR